MASTFEGENLYAKLKFSNIEASLPDYDVSMAGSPNFIETARFSSASGNRNVNPLGIISSSTIYLNIFDVEDNLNPLNPLSPYYNYMVNGLEVEITIDGLSGSFGTFYVTSWTGSYENGHNGLASLACEDIINTYGSMPLPDIDYTGTTAKDAVIALNNATGIMIAGSDYLKNVPYDTMDGTYIRDVINDICQRALMSLVCIRGVMRFIPALEESDIAAEKTLTGSDIGSLKLLQGQALNFSKVQVTYPKDGSYSYSRLLNVIEQLYSGNNHVEYALTGTASSIESVSVELNSADTNTNLVDLTYEGSQKDIKIDAEITGNDVLAEINVYGLVIGDGNDAEVTVDIPGSSLISTDIFVYNSKIGLTDESALDIAEKLADYLVKLRNRISVSTSALSPAIKLGDTIKIVGTDTIYDGVYRLTAFNISYGLAYNTSFELVRIGEVTA